jgi:hypothetical protein
MSDTSFVEGRFVLPELGYDLFTMHQALASHPIALRSMDTGTPET